MFDRKTKGSASNLHGLTGTSGGFGTLLNASLLDSDPEKSEHTMARRLPLRRVALLPTLPFSVASALNCRVWLLKATAARKP